MASLKPLSLNISLDAAGLVALADLPTIAERTAITGGATLLDVLLLAPGIHLQQTAPAPNAGEFPAVAAMTTGHVFRVENPATVYFLQKIGISGQLVNVEVALDPSAIPGAPFARRIVGFLANPSLAASALYLVGPVLTVAALVLMVLMRDWWGFGVLCVLMLARLCNVLVIRHRIRIGWKGAIEPGKKGDLLVLLSQDRWVRIRGLVDDLKAVTSGQWMQDMSDIESFFVAISTLLVYVVAAFAGNTSQAGSLIILCLLLLSVAALGLSNSQANTLQMHGRILKVVGEPEKYARRLDLAEKLVHETGRSDWAIGLGMIVPEKELVVKATM